jgi:LacI family transcriptional regulator
VPDFANPFFGDVVAAATEELRKAGYLAIVASSEENAGRERALVRELTALGVVGLLIAPAMPDYEHLQALQSDDFPFVLMDRVFDELSCDWVAVENVMAACQLCETLFSHGARRIGYIGAHVHISTHRQRLEGYRAALRRQRVPFSKELVFLGESCEETGRKGAEKFLGLGSHPDAIFCSSNKHFAGCLDRLAEAPRVPWDHLPVACFDEVPFLAHLGRPVLVVAQPEVDIGIRGAQMLMERIRREPGNRAAMPYTGTLLEVEQKSFGF